MTHKFLPFLAVAMTVFLLSSCLSNDDEDNTTYYDDTAMSGFTLGTLKVKHHTTASDGVSDSTYTTSLTGSTYKFTIDQLNATVYNPDSLPVGTDAAHVLATITTVNSGVAVLHLTSSTGSDSLVYYSSSDSIDFTNPVKVRVYNMRATAYREYTITLNVHKERADSFQWRAGDIDAALAERRFVTGTDNNLYLTGVLNGSNLVYGNTGSGWNAVNVAGLSTDSTIIGQTDKYVYALRDGSILHSADNGTTWVAESIDDDADNLPLTDANLIVRPSKVNANTNNLILIGNRNGRTVVWSKVEENDNDNDVWTYYSEDSYNAKTLPYLSNLRAVGYNDGIVATGGDFTKVYFSPDNGLTWDVDSTYTLPSDFGYTESHFAFGVDTNNIMYITKDGSNQIWSGRLAKLGWSKE